MYPVYVAQVQQQLHIESNEAYVHLVFRTQFIHTHMSPQIWWWVCQNTFVKVLVVLMTAQLQKLLAAYLPCVPSMNASLHMLQP
jgi:hypothetical protein